MGPNGAGKSTFLKLLTHKLTPVTGTVTHHPNYVLAYFGQHSTAELDLQMTPIEWMNAQFPDEKPGLLRQHLGKTSVVGTVADTRMMRLSFSQRSCVIFSKLTYKCPHLLILDEPTNFLDLESVDALISACNKYKGALLLVSHNRDFLRKCATHYLSIVPGKFDLFDNMKKAEQSTYTFIAEMEEGVKGVGRDALANNPGGAAIHSRQVAPGDKKVADKPKGPVVLGGGSGAPAPKAGSVAEKAMLERKAAQAAERAAQQNPSAAATTAKPAASSAATGPVFEAKEKCMALWKDGKYYTAVVEKVSAPGKYQVKYLEYGNVAIVPAASLKKAAAPAKK
jgi:ABC-type Mn2+/Zn2+ transport system ATPase subunit